MRWPTRMVPLRIRPTAMRPTYSFADRLVTRSWSGCPGSYAGGRRDVDEQVEQRPEVRAGHGQVAGRRAGLAFVYTTGNSIWCSSAPRSMNSS